MIDAQDQRVTRVMADTGMDRLQAWRHVAQADALRRKLAADRRAAADAVVRRWVEAKR